MSTPTPRLVLSPCGTSLLTNESTDGERRLLTRHSNTARLEDMGEDRAAVEARISSVRNRMQQADASTARRASAELNGILTLCDEEPVGFRYHHILLCTDTWLGEQTGSIVRDWLQHNGHPSVELRRQPDLQTADHQCFQSALSDLVHWLDSTVEGYRDQQYQILFNLTGGFKSVQGFLQTLGNLYADETLYVFEAPNSPLLRIPRLPVRLEIMDALRSHLHVIRRLANGLSVSEMELQGIPGTFLLRIGTQTSLSPWGTVVWEQSRKVLYAEKVWPSLSNRAIFASSFLPSTQNQSPDRLVNVNDKIDRLAVHLEGIQKKTLKSLDLKALKGNPKPPSTHEFDAWADGDARRVYCHYEGDQLVLDRLDKALH